MERQKGIKERIAIGIIVLFHAVGLAGFITPAFKSLFITLVPYHLLLMLMVVFYSYGRASLRLAIFFTLIWAAGFCCEYVGVHRGWLFGNYVYGHTLGPKLDNVPLLIGVNWFLLIFSVGSLMQKTKLRKPALRIVCGAAVLTLLDVCIEPVAVKMDYWQWTNGMIPLKNYVCWFLLGLIMLWLFELCRFRRLNYAGPVLLLMQFIFFIVLYWV